MSFNDVIKNSVIKAFSPGSLTAGTILVTLGMAAFLGLFIYWVYRLSTRSGVYNRSFNKTLAALPMITAGIMLAMQSNLVISLGMVGALSIVRFRNAVKDSVDLTFLFWSISLGIIVGAGLLELAVLLSLGMTVLIFGLDLLPVGRPPYLLVISGNKDSSEQELLKCVAQFSPRYKVRSRNLSNSGMEWILELRVKAPSELISSVSAVDGISSVHLLSHDGDVRY